MPNLRTPAETRTPVCTPAVNEGPPPREAGPSAAGPGCSQPLRGFVYPSPQSRSVVLVTVRQNQPCSRDDRGPWQNVTVPANSNPHIALVMRRHIDLKRVCSCCCLP
ncbi:Ms4527A family Cys-rich leader peptide [Mycobacterium marinum]|uniref:Ms4527A family Cys-rich leader peptide n=1 Tax=Mycobacterium ulcerans group TaxID=2993898 RepID=UPI0038BBBE05